MARFIASVVLMAAAVGATAQPAVLWSTNYYAVTGASIREIHQSLRQNRPWRKTSQTDAYTRWNVTWSFYVSPGGDKCRLTSFSTRTTVTITLPRWEAPADAPEEVRTAWSRYIAALGNHEAGHGQFAVAAAGEMQKRVRESGEDSDCSALKQKINSLAESIVQQYRNREKEYDERTKHGATQGAVLGRGGRGRIEEQP